MVVPAGIMSTAVQRSVRVAYEPGRHLLKACSGQPEHAEHGGLTPVAGDEVARCLAYDLGVETADAPLRKPLTRRTASTTFNKYSSSGVMASG